MNKRINE